MSDEIQEDEEYEPLTRCRKRRDGVETGSSRYPRTKLRGQPVYCLGGTRHKGGVTLYQALVWNGGTCRSDVKGETQMEAP
jgi:hypothetical protein